MGFKKTNSYHLISSGSMAGTATLTSSTQNVSNFDNVGVQITWTGTPTGTFSVLASIDNTNFYALTFNPALAAPAGSAGGFLINLNQLPFPYIQIRYVNASGSGTLQVYLFSKDIN